MSNKIFNIVERFYRSAYGQHKFLLNHAGIEMQLYKPGNINETVYPASNEEWEKYLRVYGPSFTASALYSPHSSVKILMKIYSISKLTEETSDLGEITAYTYSNEIEKGHELSTTINNKTIRFKVKDKKTIGIGTNIVYELTLSPFPAQDNTIVTDVARID